MPFNGMNVCAGKFMTQQSSEKGRFGLFLVFEKMKNEIFPCEYSAPVCTNDYRLRRFSKYGRVVRTRPQTLNGQMDGYRNLSRLSLS